MTKPRPKQNPQPGPVAAADWYAAICLLRAGEIPSEITHQTKVSADKLHVLARIHHPAALRQLQPDKPA